MTQKIVSVSLNEKEYELFLALKKYYTKEIYKLSNSEVFKVAMIEHLKLMTVENLKKYNSEFEDI